MFRKWRINATVGRSGDDFGESSTSCLTHSFLFCVRFTSHVAGGIYWIWVILRRSLHRPCIFGYTGHWRSGAKRRAAWTKADVFMTFWRLAAILFVFWRKGLGVWELTLDRKGLICSREGARGISIAVGLLAVADGWASYTSHFICMYGQWAENRGGGGL